MWPARAPSIEAREEGPLPREVESERLIERFAGFGIVLIRILALPAMRRQAERKARGAPGPDETAGTLGTNR